MKAYTGIPETTVAFTSISFWPYELFFEQALTFLKDTSWQMVTYYAEFKNGYLQFYCALANHQQRDIKFMRYQLLQEPNIILASLGQFYPHLKSFEAIIAQNWGITFAYLQDYQF